ncbi:ATP-dependent nuclease [Rhizobium leguminosarum]|uniref:ATP-dependent nuclease n=1 Tax=Rhizobium leguminosarum TaxID=384 RepID=UPI001C93B8A5|nr:AAA family ATPase [Rhizobium leguminosarum]
MKIEKLVMTNFRCFGPEGASVVLEAGVTALIGANGSGKTAVFQALSRLFGIGNRQRLVTRRDFHLPWDQAELMSGASLSVDVLLGFPELAGLEDADAVPEFFVQMAASAPGEPLKARMQLRATWTDDGTPEGSIDEELRWIRSVDEDYNWSESKRVQAVERSAIQLIYVPARRDADSQVATLLKGRLWKAARWSLAFREATEASTQALQDAFADELPGGMVLDRLTRRWSELHEADTDAGPALELIQSRFDELVRNAMFVLLPNGEGRSLSLDDLSDGQRSLFHIALTAATLEVEREAFRDGQPDSAFDREKLRQAHLTFLAVEEPENSLSPFFLSRLVAQARDIASNPTAQVAMSSHSPAILSRIEPKEVRYLRLENRNRVSMIKKLTLPPDDDESGKYVRLAVKAYPELYFARFVILGEGDSERLVIPRVAEAMGVPLDPSFVPIVPLAGRYVGHFWRLLSDLNIPFATLIDFDLGRRHGGAKAIRNAITELTAIGRTNELFVADMLGVIEWSQVDHLRDADLRDGWENNAWLQTLRNANVFFSYPLDIDFAMLRSVGDLYRHPRQGGRGPRTQAADIAAKKVTTLKTDGKPALYDARYDEAFAWYPYLFLDSSKPETHLAALARLQDDARLAADAPPEILSLIKVVRDALRLGEKAE